MHRAHQGQRDRAVGQHDERPLELCVGGAFDRHLVAHVDLIRRGNLVARDAEHKAHLVVDAQAVGRHVRQAGTADVFALGPFLKLARRSQGVPSRLVAGRAVPHAIDGGNGIRIGRRQHLAQLHGLIATARSVQHGPAARPSARRQGFAARALAVGAVGRRRQACQAAQGHKSCHEHAAALPGSLGCPPTRGELTGVRRMVRFVRFMAITWIGEFWLLAAGIPIESVGGLLGSFRGAADEFREGTWL